MSARRSPYWDGLQSLAAELSETYGPRFEASGLEVWIAATRSYSPEASEEELSLEVDSGPDVFYDHDHLVVASRRWFSDTWDPQSDLETVRETAIRTLDEWAIDAGVSRPDGSVLSSVRREFRVWSGSPSDLVRCLARLGTLMEHADVEAFVEHADGRTMHLRSAPALEQLSDARRVEALLWRAEDRSGDRIEVALSRRGAVPPRAMADAFPNLARLGRGGQSIRAAAGSRERAEQLADAALEILASYAPSWSARKGGRGSTVRWAWRTVAWLLLSGAFIGSLIFWPDLATAFFFWLLTIPVLAFLVSPFHRRLFPSFEVHPGRSRWQRFGVTALALLFLVPAGVGLILRLIFPVAE